MKYSLRILLLVLISLAFVSCSDDDPASPDESTTPVAAYYPGAAGSTFTYSVQGGGERIVNFSESSEHNGIYIKQTSTIDTAVSVSFFRRTDAGLYFYIDTTGLSGFIPDSLSSILTLNLDKEVTTFIKTFNTTVDWVAFKMDVNLLTIPYNVIMVNSHYEGTEDLVITPGSSALRGEKVRYDMKFTIPNMTGGPAQTQTFTAHLWFVKDVGIAKLEGNATVLNALSGGGIDFADTNKIMTQSLVSYDIK